MGSKVTQPAGQGGTLYLMRIERELYNEIRAEKDKVIDEKEAEMKRAAKHPEIEGTGFTLERGPLTPS